MNYLETLQASPVWERFNNWYDITFCYDHDRRGMGEDYYMLQFEKVKETFQLAALVDWLDSEGVHIGIYHFRRDNMWRAGISFDYESSFYTSRSEALKAGILKGFDVLEKK